MIVVKVLSQLAYVHALGDGYKELDNSVIISSS